MAPVAVTAGAAAGAVAAVAAPAPARAATNGSVLILSPSVAGGSSGAEAAAAEADGYSVGLASSSAWDANTTTAGFAGLFSGYAAVIIGDPSAGGSCSSSPVADAASTASEWGPAITGNVAVLGTAPALAGSAGTGLIRDAIGWAVSGGSGKTGLYVSLNCDYAGSSVSDADAGLLNGVDGGGFAVTGQASGGPSCSDSGTVNTWEAESSATFAGLAGAALSASSWGAACPVQETFDAWPGSFTPVAYDASAAPADFTASDGTAGQPYVLLGTPPASAATLALSPSSGGDVPALATAGGSNPAARGVSQPTAGDPVNTENGDFTQADTDFSIPGPGPSLGFTRTYDAQAAQQEELTGMPGALGYGWTDNWASSLTKSAPVPGDIYALDGLAGAAGTGLAAYAASGQAPVSAPLGYPGGVLRSGANLYFSDTGGNRVEEVPGSSGTQWGISMTAGKTYTIAGSSTGNQGGAGDGGQADEALLSAPMGLAMDSSGDLYIADSGNWRVQKVTPSGTITTAAGHSALGDSGDGGPATKASLGSVDAVTLDSHGDLYLADAGDNQVREVPASSGRQWGQMMTAGDIYTIVGSAAGTPGASGNGTALGDSLLDDPMGVSVSSTGLYIADTGNCRVEEIPDSSGSYWGISMTGGDFYTVAGRSASDCTGGGDGKPARYSDLEYPDAVTAASGNLYIADTGADAVREVAGTAHTEFGQPMTAGYVYTVAGRQNSSGDSGDGGPATSALLDHPGDVTRGDGGDLYIADSDNNQIRELTQSTAEIARYAGDGQTLASAGNGGPAIDGELVRPGGEVADASGDLYISDTANNRVQEVAASTHTQWGIRMTAGEVYTIAGSAAGESGDSGDGGPATSALMNYPEGLAFDAKDDLLVVDQFNNQVREVSAATGDISTIAGSAAGTAGTGPDGGAATSGLLDHPFGLAVDASGDIYIADKVNNRIQEIYASGGESWGQSMTAGDIYTVAGSVLGMLGDSGDGGAATAALLNGPEGVTTDAAGNLYVADTQNEQVREIPAATGVQWDRRLTRNDIYTLAGSASGTKGSGGDGGPAASSLLHTPVGLATDRAGDVYIADGANDRVQEVADASGTQWGTQMTAGDIYTIAGKPGTASDTGNGGAATMATIYFAMGNSVDSYGDLYISDWSSGQLREVTSATPATISPAPGLASALYPAPGSTIGGITYPGGITLTQPGGAQVTFYPQESGGTCPAPEVTAGQYCVMPIFQDVALTSNTSKNTYTYTTGPGGYSFTYSWDGQLISEADTAGDTLTITYDSPAPGASTSGTSTPVPCPSSATSCETITAASGRTLVVGSGSSGLVTSVTDPMGRQWIYTYNSADQLTSASDPRGHVTSYTYDSGNANPLLASDLLTITGPNAQPGGPDAGDDTVNAYDSSGRVITQTDPMGYKTTFSYCADTADGDCMNPSTGSGYVTVTDPDASTTVYDYDQGTLAAQSSHTGSTLTSEQDYMPDTTAEGISGGTLLDSATFDGDQNQTRYTYNSDGDPVSVTAPSGDGQPATTTIAYTSMQDDSCDSNSQASAQCTASQAGPAPVAPGGAITPPSSPPPPGQTWALFDTDGNELYSTTGVYEPGATTAAYSQTTYQLFKGNSIALNGNSLTCGSPPPSESLPCATINADGVVTQLAYDSAGDLTSSSSPDGNGSQSATTTYAYDGDGEQTSTTSPDGNLPGANAANYTTTTAYNADGRRTSVTQAGGTGATVTPRATGYEYDADGNQTAVTDARGYTTTTAYNADDNATLVADPDGNATLTCYDGNGDTAQIVPPMGVTANSLTPSACPTVYPAGYGTRLASDAIVTTFNGLGEQTQQTTPAPAGQSGYETTSYSYDGDGNVLTTTEPSAGDGGSPQVTVDTYNSARELVSETTGSGTAAASTTSYCYDPDGDQTSVIYPDGNTSGVAPCEMSSPWDISASSHPTQAAYQVSSSYDSEGELTSTTSQASAAASAGATTTYSYDPAGNILTTTDPNHEVTTWTYNPAGQIATKDYSNAAAHSVSYSYDADGSQTGMTDAMGASSYIYDPFGELTSETTGAGQKVGYSYNSDGEVTAIAYPLPATATWASTDSVGYEYDHADQLTSVIDLGAALLR